VSTYEIIMVILTVAHLVSTVTINLVMLTLHIVDMFSLKKSKAKITYFLYLVILKHGVI
jgi:hypothetical protein